MTTPLSFYPTQLIDVMTSHGGQRITIRPFLQQDQNMQKEFFANLSNDSRYLRFMTPSNGTSETMLDRLSRVDHRKHCLLIATTIMDEKETMIAEARFMTCENSSDICEFAISIAVKWRGKGLGIRLLSGLECRAAQVGFNRIVAETFAHNYSMIKLGKNAGYAVSRMHSDLSRAQLTKVLSLSGQAWRVSASAPQTAAA